MAAVRHPSAQLLASLLAMVWVALVLFGGVTPIAAQTTSPPSPPSLLFRSGFEPSSFASALTECWGGGCWHDIQGFDSTTGYQWPASVWGGNTMLQLLADASATSLTAEDVGNYMTSRIEAGTGRNGSQALYSEVRQTGQYTQDVFMLPPASEQGDLYISFWMKFQPDLLQKMTPQTWRAFFEWKTSGDYRVIAYAASWGDGCGGVKPNGALFWQVKGDNYANGGLPYQEFWRVDNCSIAVPVGEWFKFEVFWHRSSGSDGRVWMAVNGNVVADRFGPNIGVNNAPINRIMMPNLYTQHPVPWYQWVDDVQIWGGFPTAGPGDPWYDPPYAPH
jgi:hypothetical protein